MSHHKLEYDRSIITLKEMQNLFRTVQQTNLTVISRLIDIIERMQRDGQCQMDDDLQHALFSAHTIMTAIQRTLEEL